MKLFQLLDVRVIRNMGINNKRDDFVVLSVRSIGTMHDP